MLNEEALRRIGFNDSNVIRHILNDPNERARYERELGFPRTNPDGSTDYAGEIERAYDDLGAYYDELLKLADDDLNLALSRLQQDYETGVRFQRESAGISEEALDLARLDMAGNIDSAKRVLEKNLVSRGVLRGSPLTSDTNMGIATQSQNRLQGDINLLEDRQNLREQEFQLGQEQDTFLRDQAFTRGKEDVTREDVRYRKQLAEERKQKATTLGSSRAARAFQRFESGLI